MTSVNDDPRLGADHIAALLGLALRRIRSEILATSEDQHPGLRVSHYRLLELIPPDGARITDLAEVATMTKQGLGQHVDYLQKLGYTESSRLPTDRRVRLVRRTPLGDEAVAYSRAAIARVEQSWSTQLGPTRYAHLRQTLHELGTQP
ncbi:MarR family winged helix-turn-helix transcriptional regulator [Kribbella sindirgiensis]|uniref:MarR family transcriptional regulator n=1 Tax=Kribbella sindirgiensis TaxID=1124744 RepID=A0A4R0IZR1_9ACTN|nr:MarR family winged helix-turn-helix transcriptional regulator [Kribbella sindirgiensis]TCC39621.1 MarR family transcriptional regulator [Kribbella sindirgiensis]